MDNRAYNLMGKIARDLNLPYEKVRKVCEFQFQKVIEVIDKGEEDIRLPFLGKFLNYKTWKQSIRREEKE